MILVNIVPLYSEFSPCKYIGSTVQEWQGVQDGSILKIHNFQE